MSDLSLVHRTVGKEGFAAELNQDRVAYCWQSDLRLRVAVSDGATQAHAPGLWAQLLVDAFVAGQIHGALRHGRLLRAAETLAAVWAEQTRKDLQAEWYRREHAKRGSHATLAGLSLDREGRRWRWQSLCIGDTVVLHVGKDGSLVRAFPYVRVSQFSRMPLLLSTSTPANEALRGKPLRSSGWLGSGESLWLATDAIGAWLLRAFNSGERPARHIGSWLRSDAAFSRGMGRLRGQGLIVDDDTTLMRISRA
jgi:hypothetical protein